MKDQKLPLYDRFSLLFLSFFGTGYFPYMPGTVGSLATIPLILLLHWMGISLLGLASLILFITLIACYEAHRIQEKKGVQDPGWIVIDEVIGMLITWMFIFPRIDGVNLALVFGIFRFFDIIKIFPANWLDKNIKNGAGTIIDDVASALYAGFIIWGVNYFHLIN